MLRWQCISSRAAFGWLQATIGSVCMPDSTGSLPNFARFPVVSFQGSPECPVNDLHSCYIHMNSCSRRPAADSIQQCFICSRQSAHLHLNRCTSWSIALQKHTEKAVQHDVASHPQWVAGRSLLHCQRYHAGTQQLLACSPVSLAAENAAATPPCKEAEQPAVGIQIIGAAAVAYQHRCQEEQVLVPEATAGTHITARRRRQSSQQQQQQQQQQHTLQVTMPPAVVPQDNVLSMMSEPLVSEQQQLDVRQLLPSPVQQQARTRVLLLGIDPDSNGAIAVVAADLVPRDSSSSTTSAASGVDVMQQQQQPDVDNQVMEALQQRQQQQQWDVQIDRAQVWVYDMPVQSIPLKKASKNAPQRTRRRLDILGAIGIIRQVLADEQQRQQAQQLHVQDLNSSSKSEGRSGYTDCVASRPALLLRALVEVSSIVPTNGSLSILNQGYSIGAWSALLMSLGFEVCTVHVKCWKKHLGLLSQDKDSSRQLAIDMYNNAGKSQQDMLRRKRDHGRAEALLIAAWGLGCCVAGDSATSNDWSSLTSRWGPLREPVHMDGGMHMLDMGTASALSDDEVSDGNVDITIMGNDGSMFRPRRVPRVLDVAAATVAAADAAAAKRALKKIKKQRQPPKAKSIDSGAADLAVAQASVAASAGSEEGSTPGRRMAATPLQPAGLQAQGGAVTVISHEVNRSVKSTAQAAGHLTDAVSAGRDAAARGVDSSSGSSSSSSGSLNCPGDSASSVLSSASTTGRRRRRKKG